MIVSTGPSQIESSPERGCGHDFPSLTKKLSPTDKPQKEKISFHQWSLIGYINHSQGQAPCLDIDGQLQMNSRVFGKVVVCVVVVSESLVWTFDLDLTGLLVIQCDF